MVAKLASRGVQHKTDVGAVRLNLTSEAHVRRAFADIMVAARKIAPASEIDGVLIQPMIEGGVETMIGVADDPCSVRSSRFGLGGIHVEVLGDVRFRIAPLTDHDADELLHGIRGVRAARRLPRSPAGRHRRAARGAAAHVGLAVDIPEIVELDLNPVIALPPGHGCRIVDARVRVRAKKPA